MKLSRNNFHFNSSRYYHDIGNNNSTVFKVMTFTSIITILSATVDIYIYIYCVAVSRIITKWCIALTIKYIYVQVESLRLLYLVDYFTRICDRVSSLNVIITINCFITFAWYEGFQTLANNMIRKQGCNLRTTFIYRMFSHTKTRYTKSYSRATVTRTPRPFFNGRVSLDIMADRCRAQSHRSAVLWDVKLSS